ncbi:Hypothetical_protein [Hexamita inflata]|uniref:Hypothetical_protein n=1 Tax=Hexamita inflata TaxID=28002 RepID=A0ABP1JXK5_9EUKA
MNHQEKLQKLIGLQNLLQELNALESETQKTKNNIEESIISSQSQIICNNVCQKAVNKMSTAQKKERFSDACKIALKQFIPIVQAEDSKDLCIQIDQYLLTHEQRTFWAKVQSMIPEKTITQVKEYYQKCFQRSKYNETISEEDKIALKELSDQMKDFKPAQVADHFLASQKNQKYFKRTLVMFIVYFRK